MAALGSAQEAVVALDSAAEEERAAVVVGAEVAVGEGAEAGVVDARADVAVAVTTRINSEASATAAGTPGPLIPARSL
jgi:hypothetical protein